MFGLSARLRVASATVRFPCQTNICRLNSNYGKQLRYNSSLSTPSANTVTYEPDVQGSNIASSGNAKGALDAAVLGRNGSRGSGQSDVYTPGQLDVMTKEKIAQKSQSPGKTQQPNSLERNARQKNAAKTPPTIQQPPASSLNTKHLEQKGQGYVEGGRLQVEVGVNLNLKDVSPGTVKSGKRKAVKPRTRTTNSVHKDARKDGNIKKIEGSNGNKPLVHASLPTPITPVSKRAKDAPLAAKRAKTPKPLPNRPAKKKSSPLARYVASTPKGSADEIDKQNPTKPAASKNTKDVDPTDVLEPIKKKQGLRSYEMGCIEATELELVPHLKPQPPVASLAYGLDRALFNPGVYHLRDPRSRVFNFDPYLQNITPVDEFDFGALKEYITSSRDEALISAARELKTKYTGSTSSMTSALAHFHYLLSCWREVTVSNLSKGFPTPLTNFTAVQRSPAAIFLRWKDGTYAIDADKQFDTPNILSMLGKSMEKFLTLPTAKYERYRRENSSVISEEERNEAEAFNYTTMGDFLMRSQLDAFDPRLPGTGMFDLKTRAVVSIRMDAKNYKEGLGYEIMDRFGEWNSFEREYYDMIRSAFLKYSLQVRMGRMEGIYVAFHNTERIFGFQYISLPEMDLALHGTEDTTTGDSEFKLSLKLLNRVLDRATKKFPKQSLRIHFETRPSTKAPYLYAFAVPITDAGIESIHAHANAEIIKFETDMLGLHSETSVSGQDGEMSILGEDPEEICDGLHAEAEEDVENGELELDSDPVMDDLEECDVAERGQLHVGDDGLDDSIVSAQSEGSNENYVAPGNEDATSVDRCLTGSAQDKTLKEAMQAQDVPESSAESLDGEEAPWEPPQKMLGMYLTTRNKVNGKYVVRPEGLTEGDKWTVEYALADIPNKGVLESAGTLYGAILKRRKTALVSYRKTNNSDLRLRYEKTLAKMAARGREYRELEDKLDTKEPLKVYMEEQRVDKAV